MNEFERYTQEEREELIAFVGKKYGWPPERAAHQLKQLDHIGLAYVWVDIRLAKEEKPMVHDYNPFSDMFKGE